ncbi:MAG: hypothetical protein J7642_10750 [Cyanobacteria bacterium SBC]|nr:hypothetical protein [Cyanobacteria bacterium SBC]
MDFPPILNVAIGLVFVYLTLSLVVSAIQEAISALLEWRAIHLKGSIEKLLIDRTLVASLYEHPLFASLNQQGDTLLNWFKQKWLDRGSAGPSYVPSTVFATVLLAVLVDRYQLEFETDTTAESAWSQLNAISDNPSLRITLQTLVKQAQTRSNDRFLVNWKTEIAQWFDLTMERASGVYRRNAKGVALLLGLMLTLVTNADTLNILDRLSADGEIRSSVSRLAVEFVQTRDCNSSECLGQPELTQLVRPPLGWNISDAGRFQLQPTQNDGYRTILGWSFTAIALSMGAPFWFEVLNKLANVRDTGKKPDPTNE